MYLEVLDRLDRELDREKCEYKCVETYCASWFVDARLIREYTVLWMELYCVQPDKQWLGAYLGWWKYDLYFYTHIETQYDINIHFKTLHLT